MKKPDYKEIGRRIRRKRKALGLTQEYVAEQVDISLSFFGHLERGSRKASIETLCHVCEALSVSSDYVLGLDHASGDDKILYAIELLTLALDMADKL